MNTDAKQACLASIEGLTLADCLLFFDAKASERDKAITALVETRDESFESDNSIISEGDDNGAYVLGWRWVSFVGTEFDKKYEIAAHEAGWEPFQDKFNVLCWRDKADGQTWAGTAKQLCHDFNIAVD